MHARSGRDAAESFVALSVLNVNLFFNVIQNRALASASTGYLLHPGQARAFSLRRFFGSGEGTIGFPAVVAVLRIVIRVIVTAAPVATGAWRRRRHTLDPVGNPASRHRGGGYRCWRPDGDGGDAATGIAGTGVNATCGATSHHIGDPVRLRGMRRPRIRTLRSTWGRTLAAPRTRTLRLLAAFGHPSHPAGNSIGWLLRPTCAVTRAFVGLYIMDHGTLFSLRKPAHPTWCTTGALRLIRGIPSGHARRNRGGRRMRS